eukprot:TRINITY_DN4170_c0_g1_i1.p1 TRINITY_DN4170_c0_g1~~TRINITY_DN4170_c0_g1_i1.p1  ORF type:complete len:518 (-),score=127.45 TRINITY_DN4170_c0_g1_i1:95-1648(-)
MEATGRVYQQDSFLFSFESRLLHILPLSSDTNHYSLVLDKTIFFPEGGGQPYDTGNICFSHNSTLFTFLVQEVKIDKSSKIISHVCKLKEFQQVTLIPSIVSELPLSVISQLDTSRRIDHMQQHSSQHLITAIADKRLNLGKTLSWALLSDMCTIDIDNPQLKNEQIEELEKEVNAVIRRGVKVIFHELNSWEEVQKTFESKIQSRFINESSAEALDKIRLVEIEGIDLNPCCGTHVTSLSFIQMIKLVSVDKTCGKSRLTFIAGERILKKMSFFLERERDLNKLICAGPDEHLPFIQKTQAESRLLQKEKKLLMEEVAENVAKAILEKANGQVDSRVTPHLIYERAVASDGTLLVHYHRGEEEGKANLCTIDFLKVIQRHLAPPPQKDQGKRNQPQQKGNQKQRQQNEGSQTASQNTNEKTENGSKHSAESSNHQISSSAEVVFFLTCGEENKEGSFLLFSTVTPSADKDKISLLGKKMCELVNGKGGGKGSFQGKCLINKSMRDLLWSTFITNYS